MKRTAALPRLAEAFSAELTRTGDPALSFAERFGIVIERQWTAREGGRLARRLKNAQLRVDACAPDLDDIYDESTNVLFDDILA